MDWITRQKIDQLCKENNCVLLYNKDVYGPPVSLWYRSSRSLPEMEGGEQEKYLMDIYAYQLTNPNWKSLSATIREFATACSIRDCFEQ